MAMEKATELLLPSNIDLNDHYLYINRELSWLDFNGRVLEGKMEGGIE